MCRLRIQGNKLSAAGLSRAVVEAALASLNQQWTASPCADDDYTEMVRSAGGHTIHIHDDCMISAEPVDDAFVRSFIETALQLHNYYLGTEIKWSGVMEWLHDEVCSGHEIALQANRRRGLLRVVRLRSGGFGLGNRLKERYSLIDVSTSTARLLSR